MQIQIGTLLLEENYITADQLELAQKQQRQSGGRLGSILVKLGFVDDDDITALLSKKYSVPSINLTFLEIDPAIIKLIPGLAEDVIARTPAQAAPYTMLIAATSLSAWTNTRPSSSMRFDMCSRASVWGVMG